MNSWRIRLASALLSGVVIFSVSSDMDALAETRLVPQSNKDIQLSYSPLVKKAVPAVVNVYAEKRVRPSQYPRSVNPFFEQFFGRNFEGPMGQTRPRVEQSLGSGVIVDATGLVVTNNHVIADADEVKVSLSDGREFSSKILLRDETADLAVLKIDSKETFPVLEFSDSDNAEVGDLVLAIGNPFGVGQTVTSGIVSAQSRTQVGISDLDFFIQTDAAINPGNSGGALVDMQGKLLGVNTAIYSRSGGSVGIGFAIPSNMVKAVVEVAASGASSFERPYIGATFQTITADLAESLGMDRPYGTLITDLNKDGPAEKAGLRVGDVVLSVNNIRADNPDVLGYRLSVAGINKEIKLQILRENSQIEIPVLLAKQPEVKPAKPELIEGANPFSGASVADLTSAVAEKLRLRRDMKGVVIIEVYQRSPAARVGLRQGDIIRGINGAPIHSVSDLKNAISAGRGLLWRLEIERDGALIRQFVR